jgi:excisionase family DNA binding protein
VASRCGPRRAQYSPSRSSAGGRSRAFSSRTSVVRRISRLPRSMRETCTGASPVLLASSSWVQPWASRAARTLQPKRWGTVGTAWIVHGLSQRVHDQPGKLHRASHPNGDPMRHARLLGLLLSMTALTPAVAQAKATPCGTITAWGHSMSVTRISGHASCTTDRRVAQRFENFDPVPKGWRCSFGAEWDTCRSRAGELPLALRVEAREFSLYTARDCGREYTVVAAMSARAKMQRSKASGAVARGVAAARPSTGGRDAADSPCEQTVLLTAGDLAARWGVRSQHVYMLAREGDLPHMRVGRYVRFREQSVAAWLDEQEVKSNG